MHIQIARLIARKLRQHRALAKLSKRQFPSVKDSGKPTAMLNDEDKFQ